MKNEGWTPKGEEMMRSRRQRGQREDPNWVGRESVIFFCFSTFLFLSSFRSDGVSSEEREKCFVESANVRVKKEKREISRRRDRVKNHHK